MHAVARLNPFDPNGHQSLVFAPGTSLAAMARHDSLPAWFVQHGEIRVARKGKWVRYEREMWAHVRPKADTLIELTATIEGGKGGKLFLALAAVALTIATAGIGAGALGGVLGSAFGAGTIGANLLSAGVGLAGQMLLKALTPSPATNELPQVRQGELRVAGISGNEVSRGDPVAGVLGRIAFSPQHLIPAHVDLRNGKVYVRAMVGCWGRNLVEDLRINGTAIAEVPGARYEVFEGSAGEGLSFLSAQTRWMDPMARGVTLINYDLSDAPGDELLLADQLVPGNALPQWQVMRTNGTADEAHVRVLYQAPLANAAATAMSIALRVEIRKVGDVTWRKLPTLHVEDVKQQGAFRTDVRLMWGKRTGRWANIMSSQNAWAAFWRTGNGQSFAYSADSYFDPATITSTNIAPVMTSNVLGGITVSASHNNATAYLFVDGGTSYWTPPLGTMPVWWKIDWGAGNAKTIRRWRMTPNNFNYRAGTFTLSGSNDDVTYTVLHSNADTSVSMAKALADYNLNNDTAYRYYRLDITANLGAASQEVRLAQLSLYETHLGNVEFSSVSVSGNYANYVNCGPDGFDIYLDPLQGWDRGEYDIRVMRSCAFEAAQFTYSSAAYNYAASAAAAYFFSYGGAADAYQAARVQNDVSATAVVEHMVTVLNAPPINPAVEPFLTRIAVEVQEMEINSISATFTSYAREWDGTVWEDTPVPTRNPAALWRDALLRADINATPLPGEILDEASLETFFTWCAGEGHTCDAVVRDRNVADVLRLLGATSRASPRQSDMWGVVIDRDRTAEPVTALLTPETSQDRGTEIAYENVPHGLRVTYLDETDQYLQKEVEVYRPGFTSENATDIQSQTYEGITSLAKATAQASYDLRQLTLRNVQHKVEVGFEGRFYVRGQLIGLSTEVLLRHAYWGLVKSITTAAGNVTGITLFNVAALSQSADEVGLAADIDAVADITAINEQFSAAIRQKDGTVFTAAITQTADTSVITFATPVADTNQFAVLQPVAIGPLGREVKRCLLLHKEQAGDDRWLLTLVPEAPDIHAP